MKTRKIGLANYLAYGAGDFLGAGTTALTAAWLLYFYTTFCGLTPIEATLIFAAARVLDAVVSPLMGFLTDNFGTTWLGKRFGRRKFFILLGIPCVFSYSAMWVGEMGFWYYLATYLLFDMVYTMILVPYETLVPEMTDDFKQKTKFSGARISMAQMSAILASFLPGILLSWLGKDNASSFFYASLVFSVLCAVMLTLVWCFTWERPREAWSEAALRAEAEKQNLTLAQSLNRLVIELSSTLRIKIFRQHLGMYLGGYIAQDVFNAVFTYYVVFVLMQEAAVASNLLGTMAIFQFIAVIAMIPLCIRFGPAPSYRMVVVLFGLSSLSYALLYYAGLSDVYSLLLLISAVAGLGRGGINYVPWNTYTYIADVDEAITLLSIEPTHGHANVAQRPGAKHPISRGAPGYAIEASLDHREHQALLGGAPLSAGAAEVRGRGYAISNDEVIPGLTSVAVPLRVAGEPPAALAVVCIGLPEDLEALARSMREAAVRIERSAH